MHLLEERTLHCPYCGEPVTVLLDASVPEQEYVEDCAVCCRPIELWVQVGADGTPVVRARRDEDSGYF